jgi:hypothetical protein
MKPVCQWKAAPSSVLKDSYHENRVILNDPPYATERACNGQRLAYALLKKQGLGF